MFCLMDGNRWTSGCKIGITRELLNSFRDGSVEVSRQDIGFMEFSEKVILRLKFPH